MTEIWVASAEKAEPRTGSEDSLVMSNGRAFIALIATERCRASDARQVKYSCLWSAEGDLADDYKNIPTKTKNS